MTRSIRQTGSGAATAIPDVVLARIAIRRQEADVAAAFRLAGEAARAAVSAVRAAGVAEADIATTDVSLQSVESGPWEDRRLDGYAASESLAITIREIASASDVLHAALSAAGDCARIDSVEFSVSDGDGAAEAARAAAFADARTRAEQYAALAGARLGSVLSIVDEPGNSGPAPRMVMASRTADSTGPAMAAGERSVTARVAVEWELL